MGNGWGFLGGMGVLMAVFFFLFTVVFIAVIGIFIYRMASIGRGRAAQAAAPEVQAQARVIDKRVEAIGPGNADPSVLASPNLVRVPMGDESMFQLHRITFEQPGGERFELSVPPAQYGLIVEGDTGTVTMRGSELLAFTREIMR